MTKQHTIDLILTATAATFVGFAGGGLTNHIVTQRKLKKSEPLLSSLLRDILTKAREENMTTEEYKKYVDEQLKFFRMVVK